MESMFKSLLSLEEDLTCSICLGTFVQPVTTPCGHNFCTACLEKTWKESYSCPQCRREFLTKPELTKNTVLCTVVDTFKQRAHKMEEMEEKESTIRCDTCMEAGAVNTCLTCMASFCEQHLKPHRENPIFRVHQLIEPIADLMERICSDHHKLMELFCTQHQQVICSQCLQAQHRECSFTSLEEQRSLKESEFREKLLSLDQKVEKTNSALTKLQDIQRNLKDSATDRRKRLSEVYQQLKGLLLKDEQQALQEVNSELDCCLKRCQAETQKLTHNNQVLGRAREELTNLLSANLQSPNNSFLKTSFNLPRVVKFEPHVPRISLDSKKVTDIQLFADSLKESLTENFKRPYEARTAAITTESPQLSVATAPPPPAPVYGSPFMKGKKQSVRKTVRTPPKSRMSHRAVSMNDLLEIGDPQRARGHTPAAGYIPINQTWLQLQQYKTQLTLDPRTAHRRIVLSEDFSRASLSEGHTNYFDCPQRFTASQQVMAVQGFTKGRFYWEVKVRRRSFTATGVAYGSIDRNGPASQLGRNSQSWCVECVDGTLTAWHSQCHTSLKGHLAEHIGVLLDCNSGLLTFYGVDDGMYPVHTFSCTFTQPVFPAFSLISNDSSITVCN